MAKEGVAAGANKTLFNYTGRTPPITRPPAVVLTKPNIGGVAHGVVMKWQQSHRGWQRHVGFLPAKSVDGWHRA